ncbi:hypothetical protein BKA70DRAFT_1449240 [Coprinopsis sp. MPI-PUGE-AT-0042]|nr:hypothetical protein BKA70DRAFT_1449240 [Coprinopsis sp. MPI-PUGE-AT-0042]
MKVPNSVLSGCHDSFTAADEKRHKSSTTHFADTGLMALQCRHDTVLWMVNMTTPGERQFYAIALLLKLFAHLPSIARVHHLRRRSFEGQTTWILRKWKAMVLKEADALDRLSNLPWDSDKYRKEWEAQVAYQTRPLARVSKNAGKKAVECITTLISFRDSLKRDLADIDTRLMTEADTSHTPLVDLVTARDSLALKFTSVEASIKAKYSRLDLTGKEELQKLATNRFFGIKVNARSIRDRIVSKLQNRRFEMECLEKVIRGGGSSEQKLHSHVEVQLKKQEPQISSLIKRYNTMCTEMAYMIQRHVAPPGSTCPPLIIRASASALDVDSLIWDDSYFDEILGDAPEWLANEDLRLGIRLWLDRSRCLEERSRLVVECTHLQEWSRRAWDEISVAHDAFSENTGLLFQITQQAEKLFGLICCWRTDLMSLPLPSTFNHALWGPSLVQLTKGTLDGLSSELDHLNQGPDDVSDEESDCGGGEGQYEDVWQILENLEVAELLESGQENGLQVQGLSTEDQAQGSPTKRARIVEQIE